MRKKANPVRKELTQSENERNRWEFLKHPLFITFISFCLGSLALVYIQDRIQSNNELRKERILILEDAMTFSSQCGNIFRDLNRLNTMRLDSEMPKSRWYAAQDDFQEDLENVYIFASKLELALSVYFPNTPAYDAFHKMRLSFQDKVTDAVQKIKARKKTGKIFSVTDHDNKAIAINKILVALMKEIGFKDMEKHSEIGKHFK